MDVLVVGSSGLLGSNVVTAASDSGRAATGTYHSTRPSLDVPLVRLDIRELDAFREILDDCAPDVVVNCAAMTDVDSCEQNPDRAFEVNGHAPGRLAALCSDRDVAFVHVSTDYVFDGLADESYDESSPREPLQVYGESKLEGERVVRDAHEHALLVRLSFVWGRHRSRGRLAGFPDWLRERLVAGESTSLFTDQRVTPSRAGAAASTILDLVEAGQSGTFHVASRSCVTPYEFGTALCERIGADEALVTAGLQADVDRPAARPGNTCLDVGKVEAALDRPQPTVEEDLNAVSSLL